MNKRDIKKIHASLLAATQAYEGSQSDLCAQILEIARDCGSEHSVLADALLAAKEASEDRNVLYYFSQLAKLAQYLPEVASRHTPKKGWRLYSLTAALVALRDAALATKAKAGDKQAAAILAKRKEHRAKIAQSKTKKEPAKAGNTAQAKVGKKTAVSEVPVSAGEIEDQPVIVDFLAALLQCREFFQGVNGKAGVLYEHAKQGKVAPMALFQGMGKDLEKLGSELARLIVVLEKETE